MLATGGSTAATLCSGNVANALAIDDTYAYFNPDDGVTQILRVELANPNNKLVLAPALLSTFGLQRAVDIALDATHVYWTTSGTGGAKTIAADAGHAGGRLALITVDDTGVYWTFCIPGQIRSEPKPP